MSVSVITPMFNESLNIENCYRNLCNQKNIEFEWVVIDDGSTDQSNSIMHDIILSHNSDFFEINLIKQANAGAAAARQNGINNCKYDVITILDSDDKLSEYALESAFAKISESVDIVCYQVQFIDSSNCVLSDFNYMPTDWPITGEKAFSECIDGWGVSGWFMAKKSILLSAYKIVNDRISENTINLDELVSRLSMYFAKEIDICDGIYFYYKNQNSTTKKMNKNYYKVIYTALELNNLIYEMCDSGLQIKSQKHLLATLWGVYFRFVKWSAKLDNKNEWILAMKMIATSIKLNSVLKGDATLIYCIKQYVKICLALYFRSDFVKVNR